MRTLLLLLTAAVLALSGCAGSKSSSRIYEGDAPSISYSSREESAGGRVGGR